MEKDLIPLKEFGLDPVANSEFLEIFKGDGERSVFWELAVRETGSPTGSHCSPGKR